MIRFVRRLRARVAQGASADAGMSLIELVVACAVFLTGTTGILMGLNNALDLTRHNRSRTVAANLASQELDEVRSVDISTVETGLVTKTTTLDTVPYTIERSASWVSRNADSGSCDGGAGSRLAYLRVSVRVKWPRMGAVKPVATDTIITPPVGTYDPNTGHVAVRVLNRDASPAAGHRVAITGPGGSDTTVTTDDGCAFFAYLVPGAYTVSLNSTGYVNHQGSQTASTAASVAVAQLTSLQFDYDKAAGFTLTFRTDPSHPAPSNLPVSVGNTNLQPSGYSVRPGSTQPRVIGSLFPFLEGYSVWAGGCLDADPEGEGPTGRIYPGAAREPALITVPGGNTNGQVATAPVEVTVRNTSGVPIGGARIRAIHAADNGCAAGEQYVVGVTAINGMAGFALPYGSWEITVDAATPLGTWPTAALTPLDPSLQQVQAVIQ